MPCRVPGREEEETMGPDGEGLCSSSWFNEKLGEGEHFIVLDCRVSDQEFNESHVSGAIHVTIPTIMQRRLKKGNISVASAIIGGSEESKQTFSDTYKQFPIILYDEGSIPNPTGILSLLHKRLREDGCRAYLLNGGYYSFRDSFPNRCSGHLTNEDQQSAMIGLRSLQITDSQDGLDTLDVKDDCPVLNNTIQFPVEVLPYLFLGNKSNSDDMECLVRNGITYVVNVTTDIPNAFENNDSIKYLRIPIDDHWSQNLSVYFRKAIAFIDEARERKQGVLVHCLAGISRSVTVMVAYLMHALSLSLNEAYDLVRRRKPNISPNFNFMGQLLDFENSLQENRKCTCQKVEGSESEHAQTKSVCSCHKSKLYFSSPTTCLEVVSATPTSGASTASPVTCASASTSSSSACTSSSFEFSLTPS